jgi:hypothetical protein
VLRFAEEDEMRNQVLIDVSTGYLIRLPFDEGVGALVIVSVIPQEESDWNFIDKNRGNIIAVVNREDDEDLISFKLRLEDRIKELRQERQGATQN